jgi:glycosyltransferase involved in cell wall biosynthesis
MKGILILFHCGSNTGYAIGPLEHTFYEMAAALSGNVHFAYPEMTRGPSGALPPDFDRYAIINTASTDPDHHTAVDRYIREHGIDTLFGFDQPVSRPLYRTLRRAGIERFVSYWGAPMSSENGWFKRSVKRLEVALRPDGPDHYIFESHGMAHLATRGRGIPANRVSVVHLGVDTERFRPDLADFGYTYEQLGIPRERRIFFYSGHFEPRKGVGVIMHAANRLSREDWHLVLCGNKGDEAAPYKQMLTATARQHVTFAGYRNDLERLLRGCYAGIIASTGWDSFPRSGLEMQASGLPLLASDLIGLRESIDDGVTGALFPTGDADALARAIDHLLRNEPLRDRQSLQARQRIERDFTLAKQLGRLIDITR